MLLHRGWKMPRSDMPHVAVFTFVVAVVASLPSQNQYSPTASKLNDLELRYVTNGDARVIASLAGYLELLSDSTVNLLLDRTNRSSLLVAATKWPLTAHDSIARRPCLFELLITMLETRKTPTISPRFRWLLVTELHGGIRTKKSAGSMNSSSSVTCNNILFDDVYYHLAAQGTSDIATTSL